MEVSSPNIPTYTFSSFQDKEGDESFSFQRGFGLDPNYLQEYMLDAVAHEMRISEATTSVFLTFNDIWKSALLNANKILINLACNDDSGNFLGKCEKLEIDYEILALEGREINLTIKDEVLIFNCEEDHLEIIGSLKGNWRGNVSWNSYELPIPEARRLINFLLLAEWFPLAGESCLYDACLQGEVTDQDIEIAMEDS
jgi:hypothetical protein